MKARVIWPLTATGVLLLAAFSTGSVIFLMLAALLLVVVVSGFLAVWQAARTLRVETSLSGRMVRRGEHASMEITVQHRGWLPIAPLRLTLNATPDAPERTILLQDCAGRPQRLTLPFHAAHIGAGQPGVRLVTVEDLFSIFTIVQTPVSASSELLVLPVPFAVEPLNYASGDMGMETLARAMEDVTNPSDVRGYQPGDAMKKIHWKLSLRKQELLVRRFEEPKLPDTLVLLDCSAPPLLGHQEAEADMRDALLETAASVMLETTRTDNGAHLPLQGDHPMELDKAMGMPLILESLARLDFSETERFERVLLLETRRMRRVGSTVVIAARLNSRMVDVMVRMRRLGPCVRLYLVTFTPDDPALLPLISKLQQGLVEVCYVAPVPA